MISLHVTLWRNDDGSERYRVNAVNDKNPEMVEDVTDQYEVVAMATEDGKEGFAVLKSEQPVEVSD